MEVSEIYKKELEIAKAIYGSETNPEHIPINSDSLEKLFKLSPDGMSHELDENGNPICWVVAIPTTSNIADKFLNGEISEKQLFDSTNPGDKFDSLYLCSVITVPQHRRKGLAEKLSKKTIETFKNKYGIERLFAWVFSSEGGELVNKLKAQGYKIELRKEI